MPADEPPANRAAPGVPALRVQKRAADAAVWAPVLAQPCAERQVEVEPEPRGDAELRVGEAVAGSRGGLQPSARSSASGRAQGRGRVRAGACR
eukprot:1511228-Pyramimonas_sp.AAC.2